MTTIGSFEVKLIFSRPEHNTSGSAVVPPESLEALERERSRFGIVTEWWHDNDPESGERRPAFTPIEGGRLALIEGRGIQHGDRFLATFDVKEITRQGVTRREMWLVDAQPVETRS